MPVNSTDPDYDVAAAECSRARDVLAGEDAVKAAGGKSIQVHSRFFLSQNPSKFFLYKKSIPLRSSPTRTVLELAHENENTRSNPTDQQSPSAHSPVTSSALACSAIDHWLCCSRGYGASQTLLRALMSNSYPSFLI